MIRFCRRAFTLIEIMVVITIIAVLAALVLPSVIGTEVAFQKAATQSLVDSLMVSLKNYKLDGKTYPLPDEQESVSSTDPGYLRGVFRYDRSDVNPGLINNFVNKQKFALDTDLFLGEDNILTDPWGNHIRYVRGDGKNHADKSGYDSNLPQDLNKPKDADLKPEDSDWNSADERGYPYVYSEGAEQDIATWIYYKS